MPIQSHNPPAASLEALREAVQTVPKAYAHVAAMIEAILLDLPHHWPHPVYRIGLDEAASAHGLAKPTLIGWRYMARSGSGGP